MASIESIQSLPLGVVPTSRPLRTARLADVAIQVSHRAAIVGFFAILAVFGLLYVGNKETESTWAVATVFGCGDIGCCAALVARSTLEPCKLRREATAVLLFNATLLVLSLQLMLLTRLDLIRSAAEAFFRPD